MENQSDGVDKTIRARLLDPHVEISPAASIWRLLRVLCYRARQYCRKDGCQHVLQPNHSPSHDYQRKRRPMGERPLSRLRHPAQHVLQNATVLIIGNLVLSIDPA